MTVDLSAFYFDIRKDALYCDPISSTTRKACLTVLDHLFRCTVTWLAPMLLLHRRGGLAVALSGDGRLGASRDCFPRCRPPGATTRWPRSGARCRTVRRVVTGALEIERARQAHRLVARGRARRLCLRPRSVRRAGRCRPRRDLHHLGGDAGARARGRPSAFRLDDVRGRRGRCRALAAGHANARARGRSSPSVGSDPALSRRHAARRPGAARMGRDAQGGGMTGDDPDDAGSNGRHRSLGSAHPRSACAGGRGGCSIRPASSGCCSASIWAPAASCR